jgi:hypothetical protein
MKESLMSIKPTPVERWVLATVATIAILAFFFPLISLHIPVAGDQPASTTWSGKCGSSAKTKWGLVVGT